MSRALILFSVGEGGGKGIIKDSVIGRLGDLSVSRTDGLIDLSLRNVRIHTPAKTFAGVLVLIESFLVELLSLRKMLLHPLDVAQLNQRRRTLRSPPHRLLGVLLGLGVFLAVYICAPLQKESLRRVRLRRDNLLRRLHQAIHITVDHLEGC